RSQCPTPRTLPPPVDHQANLAPTKLATPSSSFFVSATGTSSTSSVQHTKC
ncbi:hypothetical protein IscW_ISCW009837, partial [Ixodes scapularis]